MEHWLFTLPTRVDALRAIKRFHIYTPMYYRTDDFVHTKRVAKIAEAWVAFLPKEQQEEVDVDLLKHVAYVHDDGEMVTGDPQASVTERLPPKDFHEQERLKLEAIDTIAARFPHEVGAYSYKELLLEGHECRTLESQIVKFADKFDAFGEALHELHAGNRGFMTRAHHPTHGPLRLPTEGTPDHLRQIPKRFPKMQPLFDALAMHLALDTPMDGEVIVARGTPHTEESLYLPTGCAPYDHWKSILLSHEQSEVEIRQLTTRVE